MALPIYVFDGRPLQWNEARTAVSFDSTDAEYFSDENAVSSTALKAFVRSPKNMKTLREQQKGDTRSRRLGRAVHARVLEAATFDQRYIVWDGERRSGYLWERFATQHKKKCILDRTEWDLVQACSMSVLATPVFVLPDGRVVTLADCVEFGQPERVIYWLDPETGLTCKARLDLVVKQLTLDLKTTDDARERKFSIQCDELGYDLQAAHYLKGRAVLEGPRDAEPFFIVAAELSIPFNVMVHPCDVSQFVGPGEVRRAQAMRGVLKCRTEDHWPGYQPSKGTLKLPFHRLIAMEA